MIQSVLDYLQLYKSQIILGIDNNPLDVFQLHTRSVPYTLKCTVGA